MTEHFSYFTILWTHGCQYKLETGLWTDGKVVMVKFAMANTQYNIVSSLSLLMNLIYYRVTVDSVVCEQQSTMKGR